MTTFAEKFDLIKLIVDIGNTRTKLAVFRFDELVEVVSAESNLSISLSSVLSRYGQFQSCIMSCVKAEKEEFLSTLKKAGISNPVLFSSRLKIPITLSYKTPETLGSDRLANVCGAFSLYKGSNVLVIDVGTCIKYDFLSYKGEYAGGSISPGLKMRYRALNDFTGQLPYFEPAESFPVLIGQSTEESIRSGVEHGILAEIEGIILNYQQNYKSMQLILTGGDANRFEDKLKSPIFVAPNLTLTGLKVILDNNES